MRRPPALLCTPPPNRYFLAVKGPQEATLDSAFLLMASNMGAMKARAMKSGPAAFDADEFISKLLAFMGGGRQVLRETREEGEGSDFEDEGEDDASEPDMGNTMEGQSEAEEEEEIEEEEYVTEPEEEGLYGFDDDDEL